MPKILGFEIQEPPYFPIKLTDQSFLLLLTSIAASVTRRPWCRRRATPADHSSLMSLFQIILNRWTQFYLTQNAYGESTPSPAKSNGPYSAYRPILVYFSLGLTLLSISPLIDV